MHYNDLTQDEKDRIKNASDEFINFLIEIGRITEGEAYLTGSYQLGTAHEDSDIDILIKANVNMETDNKIMERQLKNQELRKKYQLPLNFALRRNETFQNEMAIKGKIYGVIKIS